MQKMLVAGFTAFFVLGAAPGHAQAPSAQIDLPTEEGLKALTDLRVEVVKAVLQLRPEQISMWPAVEQAIRERGAVRRARLARIAARQSEQRERDVIELMRERSDALAQRAAALKKLADAWQPMYATLDQRQKLRLQVLAAYGLRQLMYAMDEDEEDEE